ncbi:MAG: DUF434 domain-containing protein [Sedimentisphaerales bacterium]|nr:DUF434 domain-containing protein [Sedimentisphaerales bacterium]
MPDKRTHRGQHPSDAKLFAPEVIPQLRCAAADFSLLLSKGYAEKSSLKLVGDKFSLTERQRLAIMRSSCSDQQLASRKQCCVDIKNITEKSVAIDGYNLLITIEAAMSGGILFRGRDGCLRDLASIHGTYRKVEETIPAIELIGSFLQENGIENVLWLLDSPVSNSGRLKKLISEITIEYNLDWEVELSISPDAELIKTDLPVVTSDSVILDKCEKWINLANEIIQQKLSESYVIDLF